MHPVEVALELEDPLAAGHGAGEAESGRSRLGAAAAEADDLRRRHHLADVLGYLGVMLGFVVAVESLIERLDDPGFDSRVIMAEQGSAGRTVKVDIAVVVDVVEVGPVGPLQIERPAQQRIDARRRAGPGQQILLRNVEVVVAEVELKRVGPHVSLPIRMSGAADSSQMLKRLEDEA